MTIVNHIFIRMLTIRHTQKRSDMDKIQAQNLHFVKAFIDMEMYKYIYSHFSIMLQYFLNISLK